MDGRNEMGPIRESIAREHCAMEEEIVERKRESFDFRESE